MIIKEPSACLFTRKIRMINKHVKDIAIIAGQGFLPKIVYKECVKKKINCKVIGLKGEINEKLFDKSQYELFPVHNVSAIFDYLKKSDISNIVIAGRVSRKHLPKLILDKKGMMIFKEILKNGFNDSNIYFNIIKLIESEGLKIISPDCIVKDVLAPKGMINNVKITEQNGLDIDSGVEILKSIIKCDIGQALIINNGLVLGVEAVEGTNNLIKRCAKLRGLEVGGILVKLCKPHQDTRVDLPCIGLDTIKSIAKFGYEGIVLEAQKSIIIAKEEAIKFANENGIFIYGV
jgi:DUF1009 family protein